MLVSLFEPGCEGRATILAALLVSEVGHGDLTRGGRKNLIVVTHLNLAGLLW